MTAAMGYLANYEDSLVKRLPQMEPKQFQQWTALLKQRTGMRLPDKRLSFLITNLNMRMRKRGINDYQRYYEYVTSGREGNVEWDHLIHHLTVHETRFIRQASVLALLRDKFLPARYETDKTHPATIDIWSVGCSTGEEPYSIAMTVDEYMRNQNHRYHLGISASDISRSSIAHGAKGIYNQRQIKNIDPSWLAHYFKKTRDNKFQVCDALRKRICFNQLNILNMGAAPIGMMDIIVCQNLLIYFDREQRIQIANTLSEHLRPGGLLILGVGELLNWQNPSLKRYRYENTLAFQHQ
jgi:type IV pilus assembly protein PilK